MTDARVGYFEDFDFDGFWSEVGGLEVEPYPDEDVVAAVEAELGYRLPAAYVELARRHNGGYVERSRHPMAEATGWAEDHIVVWWIHPIGKVTSKSLCGVLGSPFMLAEWEYPPIGVCFAETPSGGHEQLMLDYRQCGSRGEPRVVYVDQEDDYRITVVAPDFASFIRGLVDDEAPSG